MARLVLASASPRRRELLRRAGFDFDVVASSVVEITGVHLTAVEITATNARRKTLAVARERPCSVVLGADTVVVLDGEVIGKPENLDVAFRTVRRLAGRGHDVLTAVCIVDSASGRAASFVEWTEVHFRTLSDAEISAYFDRIDPLDKAGAYAAQSGGEAVIDKICGSFSNVVGLPMERTVPVLASFGIFPQPVAA